MSLVGKEAPDFIATAIIDNKIVENFSLSSHREQYVILFFYPLDFTFVCPTELHAFQAKLDEFSKRNAQVIGCSIDSHFSHLAWLQQPKKGGGIQGVTYPLVSDINKTIAKDYDVLFEDQGIAYRGLYLVDKEGIVRHITVNELFLGRNIEEVLRLLDGLIFYEKHGEVCPANWHEGEKAMKPTNEGLKDYFQG